MVTEQGLQATLLLEITKNLPEMVGTQLRNRLEQADKDAEELKTLRPRYTELHANYGAIELTLRDYKVREAALVAKEAEFAAKEHQFAIRAAVLEEKTKNADSQFDRTQSVLNSIFRDRNVGHTLFGNAQVPTGDGYGTVPVNFTVTATPNAPVGS